MGERIKRLIFVTPFDSGIADLSRDQQLIKLKGCVLCQITRDVQNESTRNKPEWKACKTEIGVPSDVYTIDVAEWAVVQAIDNQAPAVCAELEDGRVVLILDRSALARCRGSVSDFRGRLYFRIASLDLELPPASRIPSDRAS